MGDIGPIKREIEAVPMPKTPGPAEPEQVPAPEPVKEPTPA